MRLGEVMHDGSPVTNFYTFLNSFLTIWGLITSQSFLDHLHKGYRMILSEKGRVHIKERRLYEDWRLKDVKTVLGIRLGLF